MTCTSDPQHSAQKCFCNRKWHYKVIHASLGREMRRAEIRQFFFFPQTIPLPPLLKLTINKKCGSWRNICRYKVSWGLAAIHWGVFSRPQGTGHPAPHTGRPCEGLLRVTRLGSASTSRKPQALRRTRRAKTDIQEEKDKAFLGGACCSPTTTKEASVISLE